MCECRKKEEDPAWAWAEHAWRCKSTDNALQAIELSDARTDYECSFVLEEYMELWRKVNGSLAAEPLSKVLFLNRLFYCESELVIPIKAFAKADRECNLRIANTIIILMSCRFLTAVKLTKVWIPPCCRAYYTSTLQIRTLHNQDVCSYRLWWIW